MVLDEEEVMDTKVQCIHNFKKDRDFSLVSPDYEILPKDATLTTYHS